VSVDEQLIRSRLNLDVVERAVGTPRELWKNRCHEISLALLKSDAFVGIDARMARGFSIQITSQHSWIVLGKDVFDRTALVVDPTWSSTVMNAPMISYARNFRSHRPHGWGMLTEYPESGGGPEVEIKGMTSETAEWVEFVRMTVDGPLDVRFWCRLFSGPLQGWPSRELVGLAAEMPELRFGIPVDVVGMLTDLNPNGLYLRD